MDYRIFPPDELIDTEIHLPVSKSIANRMAIISALAGENMEIPEENLPDDVIAIREALKSDNENINIGAAGTAMRFLTAYFAAVDGKKIVLDGSERMRQRPIGVLVDALKELGADIDYVEQEGYPPLRIKGKRLHGGQITVRSNVSSQFITALLLIAPYMDNGLEITLDGDTVSEPYIKMTMDLMRQNGIEVEKDGNSITVSPGKYEIIKPIHLERDWSAASYWAEIVAVSAGFVRLPELEIDSVQGDVRTKDLFAMLGVETLQGEDFNGVEMCASPEVYSRMNIDMSDNPDLAQTIAVTCALLNIPFYITGLQTLRIKETDRLDAIRNELAKLGIIIEINGDDGISWDGKRLPVFELPIIDTYKDHRMALSFAPVALLVPGIIIKDVDVVDKSYPDYWEHLRNSGFIIEEVLE